MELYFDFLSQPSRAVFLLLKATNTDFTPKLISIFNGEHMKPEYIKINPQHKVPVLVDGDFTLTESVAQLRYVAVKQNLAESWYPRQDARMMARCDEFLNWHHLGLRLPCVKYFLSMFKMQVGAGPFTKIPRDEKVLAELKEGAIKAVKDVDECFLKGKKFILGDEISAADLIGYCELAHLRAVEADDVISSNKNVSEWIKNIEAKLGAPLVEEVSVGLKQVKEIYKSG